MTKQPEISFAQAKQNRSKKTLNDLLEAACELVDNGDPEVFTSRSLAKKSGYSLGTLNKRLTAIDKVFLWAIKKGQQRQLEQMSKVIDQFDPKLPIRSLLELLVDSAFSKIEKVNPRVIRFYDDRISKFGNANNFHHVSDALVTPFYEAMKRDQTNTFRQMSKDELRLVLRTTALFIERPIIECEPFASTKDHHSMALDNLMHLLSQ